LIRSLGALALGRPVRNIGTLRGPLAVGRDGAPARRLARVGARLLGTAVLCKLLGCAALFLGLSGLVIHLG